MMNTCSYLLSEDHQIILEKLIKWCRNQSTGLDQVFFLLKSLVLSEVWTYGSIPYHGSLLSFHNRENFYLLCTSYISLTIFQYDMNLWQMACVCINEKRNRFTLLNLFSFVVEQSAVYFIL